MLNGDEKSNSSNSEVTGSLSIANLELLECLLELENKNELIIEVRMCGKDERDCWNVSFL